MAESLYDLPFNSAKALTKSDTADVAQAHNKGLLSHAGGAVTVMMHDLKRGALRGNIEAVISRVSGTYTGKFQFTSTAHGLAVGDVVTIDGFDASVDGAQTVAEVVDADNWVIDVAYSLIAAAGGWVSAEVHNQVLLTLVADTAVKIHFKRLMDTGTTPTDCIGLGWV